MVRDRELNHKAVLYRLRATGQVKGSRSESFSTHGFYDKLIVFRFGQVLDCADGNARTNQELLFCMGKLRTVPIESSANPIFANSRS